MDMTPVQLMGTSSSDPAVAFARSRLASGSAMVSERLRHRKIKIRIKWDSSVLGPLDLLELGDCLSLARECQFWPIYI